MSKSNWIIAPFTTLPEFKLRHIFQFDWSDIFVRRKNY
jgi:hypothetical protein